jgi:hypothetical protein
MQPDLSHSVDTLGRIGVPVEVAKSTIPVAVAGVTIYGVTLNDLVLGLTAAYVVMQMCFLAYKWWRLHKDKTPRYLEEE